MSTQSTTEIVEAKPVPAPVPVEPSPDLPLPAAAQNSLFDRDPADMVAYASNVATVLKDVVKKQGLVQQIGKGWHVKTEGWSVMGSMLGILPREKEVKAHPDGSYEAIVELYNVHSGQVVGRGSHICGDPTDSIWTKRPAYARRSMAVTRATGKAYRLGFGWVMSIAGYEPTPLEEMPGSGGGR